MQDLLLSGSDFTDYTVEVTGITGKNTPTMVKTEFNLAVRNPCIDPTFVTIEKEPLPVGLEYILYDLKPNGFSFQHDAFTVKTVPIVHSLCGPVFYDTIFEGLALTTSSSPMKYDTLTRSFEIYSEALSLIGMRTIEVEAYFKDYPQVKSFGPNL